MTTNEVQRIKDIESRLDYLDKQRIAIRTQVRMNENSLEVAYSGCDHHLNGEPQFDKRGVCKICHKRKPLMTELTLEEFQEINKSELNCIFAEAGSTREADFDYDQQCSDLLYNDNTFKHLVRTKKEED